MPPVSPASPVGQLTVAAPRKQPTRPGFRQVFVLACEGRLCIPLWAPGAAFRRQPRGFSPALPIETNLLAGSLLFAQRLPPLSDAWSDCLSRWRERGTELVRQTPQAHGYGRPYLWRRLSHQSPG